MKSSAIVGVLGAAARRRGVAVVVGFCYKTVVVVARRSELRPQARAGRSLWDRLNVSNQVLCEVQSAAAPPRGV